MEHLLLEVLKLAWPGPSDGLNNLSQHLSFPDFFCPSAAVIIVSDIEPLYQFQLIQRKKIFLNISGCVEGRNVIL